MSEPKKRNVDVELEMNNESEESIDESSGANTEDEMARAQETGSKSKKTLKRKLRATSPAHFGEILDELLAGQPNGDIPLSLPRRFERQREKEREDIQLRKVQGQAKQDAEELGRITDIIGGWGVENERALRKVAQRGVIQLFNAIQQTQSQLNHSSTKPGDISSVNLKSRATRKEKPNILGRGKKDTVDAGRFLDMIREGGIVSKT